MDETLFIPTIVGQKNDEGYNESEFYATYAVRNHAEEKNIGLDKSFSI